MGKNVEQFFEERDSEGPVTSDRVTKDRVTQDRVTQDRVTIFDTTLRDGEQSPGASLNLSEKIAIAKALKELGVDVIEAGFPIASPGDFEAVKAVAKEVQGPVIAGLARCSEADIQRAAEALSAAGKSRIHVFLATSPIHRRYKLKMSKEQVLEKTFQGIATARRYCDDVEFSAEDAARTEPDFLAKVVDAAIEAGAGTVNIPDTVGYAVPAQFGDFIAYLRRQVPRINQAILSVHCHNDLGLAVANSLAAVDAGARQVECTINGIGERAGNCSLEEVVMALRTRGDVYQMQTGINTKHLFGTSQLVSRLTGLDVQRNKAIVGRNAFAHEAGIHQHGMLMHQETYEIMKPEDVGVTGNQLVLGKHSGRHAFQKWLQEQGYNLDERQFQNAFEGLKRKADEKKELFDQDLHELVAACMKPQNGPWFAGQSEAASKPKAATAMESR